MELKKVVSFSSIILFILINLNSSLGSPLTSDSESLANYTMLGRYNNRTSWDGVSFPKIDGLNRQTYVASDRIKSSPTVYNGSIYFSSWDGNLYHLNASDISQQISINNQSNYYVVESSPIAVNGYIYIGCNETSLCKINTSNVSEYSNIYFMDTYATSTPAISNEFVYVSGFDGVAFQLNLSNISQQIANYSTADLMLHTAPTIAGEFAYFCDDSGYVYQLNASNISQQIANFSAENSIETSPAVSSGYLYIGDLDGNVFQLNASNVSQKISNFTNSSNVGSPTVFEESVFISIGRRLFELNASNISQPIRNFTLGSTDYTNNAPSISDGFLYIGSWSDMYQFNVSNISQQITNYSEPNGVYYSTAAIADGYIYFGDYFNQTMYQLNASNISLSNIDSDNDDIVDSLDTLLYNESNVNTSGVTSLNITINGKSTNQTFSGSQNVSFYDSEELLFNFSHNFSLSNFDLSNVTIIKETNSLIINLSGQLKGNKTIYISDNSFTALCVKDAGIASVNNITADCSGENETDFTACLGSSLTSNGISCTDLGSTIRIDNLVHSGVRGTPTTPSDPTTGSSGGGGGSSCTSEWTCTDWNYCLAGEQTRTCIDTKCGKKYGKPVEVQECTCSENWICGF